MKVLFCSSEVFPFAKTGGLADVAGALPLALGDEGVEVKIFMPLYKGVKVQKMMNNDYGVIRIQKNVELVCVRNDAYFMRDGLYGTREGDFTDNLERFSFFCRKVLETAQKMKFKPDVVHANDWQTSLVPAYMKTLYKNSFFARVPSVLTIHNLAYQGVFKAVLFSALGIEQKYFSMDYFEFYGKINLLKAGIIFSDSVTTVSPTYSREIQTEPFGCGLDGVLRNKKDRLRGILNAIDYSVWNPRTDTCIAAPYDASTLYRKKENKFALQKELKLEVTNQKPLFGMVTRLAQQKGIDILAKELPSLVREYQFAVLGSGDKTYEDALAKISREHPKMCAVQLKFDEKLAHKIYAGADFFLMPSQFEPCGLSQMISFKYGTVPVVHHTGGLADTVSDYLENRKQGNGFVFHQYTAEELHRAIQRSEFVFHLPEWGALSKRIMKYNFSWKAAAAEYIKLYTTCSPSQ